MRRHRFAAATAGIAALLITMLTVISSGASSSHRSGGDGPIELSGDVTPEVRHLAAVVVGAAHEHGEEIAPTELEIRFVDQVEVEGFLGGWTDGRRILVGRNVALPERTLLHEIAHAVVGGGFGHGEPWRSVYMTAFRNEFGEQKAERELRRLCWVYDKSYLDTVPRPCEIAGDSSQWRSRDTRPGDARLPWGEAVACGLMPRRATRTRPSQHLGTPTEHVASVVASGVSSAGPDRRLLDGSRHRRAAAQQDQQGDGECGGVKRPTEHEPREAESGGSIRIAARWQPPAVTVRPRHHPV